MSNLVKHAKAELSLIGLRPDAKGEMDRVMYKNIISIVKLFASQGHSGFSASYTNAALGKLLDFQPLTELTGEDNEWNDVSEISGRPHWQNKRCSHVFKEADGKAYDIEGKIFTTKDGDTYTNGDSWVEITFPYYPEREYVTVED